jgi:parallel beta-helix repeat protein
LALPEAADMIRFEIILLALVGTVSGKAACVPPSDQQNISIASCGASTSLSDNKAAIDRALLAAATYKTGIFVPPGVFLTSGNHTPPSGVGIYGTGTLKLTGGSNPIVDTAYSGNTISGPTFDLSLCPRGTFCAAIDIDGGSSGTVVSSVTANGRILSYVRNGGSSPTRIVIKDNVLFSVRVGGTGGGAIEINASTHFSVVGNKILPPAGATPSIGAGSDGAGIVVATNSNHGDIIGNDTEWNIGSGIYLLGAEDVTIIGNQCSNNGQSGIGVNSVFTPRPGRLSINSNICTHNRYDGIDINEGSGTQSVYLTILGNYLASNGTPKTGGTGVYLQSVANVAISSNTIVDNGTAGIWVNVSQNVAVTGNIIGNNSKDGPVACSPTVKNIACPGILVSGSSFNTFSGNVSSNNGGSPSQSYGILEADNACDFNTYAGNNGQNNINGSLRILGKHDAQAGNL